ncbi:MAG: GDSL-like Lipase/Acylhydrolase [Smithella sp. PtaU1.Bin162]|nr:MAG: GDSL-like Lipase/Acylhydrolase [Smithella sp. PtaU1.Bin162]
MAIVPKSSEKMLFIGDSITDSGRCTTERPYGSGYVKIFRDMLIAREPKKQLEIINKGTSGNSVRDLCNRWSDDVLYFKPEWLFVKIGINDLLCFLQRTEGCYPVEKFKEIYDEILDRTINFLPNINILLITPFYISRDTAAASFRMQILEILPYYITAVREMSEKYNTRLVKTHDVFQNLLKHYDSDTFCQEPIHPNQTGHQVIAEEIYQALSRNCGE